MASKKDLKQGAILNIDYTVTPKAGVLRYIESRLINPKQGQKLLIVTPNPEQIVRAQKDSDYAQILNSAQISLPDGVGLLAAHVFMAKQMPRSFVPRLIYATCYGLWIGLLLIIDRKKLERELVVIKGREFVFDLIAFANKKKQKVFLLGSRGTEAQKAKDFLIRSYKSVQILANGAPELNQEGKPVSKADSDMETSIIAKINNFAPDILFIGISPPKQEKWLARNFARLDFKVAMLFGGTLDFLSGKLPYPPKWMEKAGLEWVWRLLTSFKTGKSVKRIFWAFPTFPLLVFSQKLRSRD